MGDYTWWENALRGDIGPIHEDKPESGYYRGRLSKGSPYVPVAIWEHWEHGGTMVCRAGYDDLHVEPNVNMMWTWCCTKPISYADFTACSRSHEWPSHDNKPSPVFDLITKVLEDGRPFPDELKSLRQELEVARKAATAQHLEAKRRVDDMFRPYFDRIDEWLKKMKVKK